MAFTTVTIWYETTLDAAMANSLTAGPLPPRAIVLPSTLEREDRVAESLTRSSRQDAHPLVPVSGGAARRAWLSPVVLGDWRDVALNIPGGSVSSVLLPKELTRARNVVVVCDIVEVARRGPFVLDLPARYVHPRQRMRMLASAKREGVAAEIAVAVPFTRAYLALTTMNGTALAVCEDIVAAELVALAMAETCLGASREFTGPWEDPVVQRATDIQLGVAGPAEMGMVRRGDQRDAAWALGVDSHVRRRLGLSRAD